MSSVETLIKKVWQTNADEVNELFSDVADPRRSLTKPEKPLATLPSRLGASTVRLTGKIAEFYTYVNGATNVVAAERWLSDKEMAGDFFSVWDDVARFEPNLLGQPDDWKQARKGWFDDDTYDVEALCTYLDLKDAADFPKTAAFVLFSYELIELAYHKTFLYFPDASGSEPIVFNMWDHSGEDFPDISEYLERCCPLWAGAVTFCT